jgi:putative phosphoribosyl transferase
MFTDRAHAGRRLAERLEHLRGQDLVVLGLPRGGVPVAYEVAQALAAPLDVLVVRKLGSPHQPELALGAIGEEGVLVLDPELVAISRISDRDLTRLQRTEQALLTERLDRIRAVRTRVDLRARTAVVIDDGVATGSTARAACRVARRLGARRVVLAVPVASARALSGFREADEVVCVSIPDQFTAVGQHYRDFSPTSDNEVVALLTAANESAPG